MGSSGKVDLENQQTVPPVAIDCGGGWLTPETESGIRFEELELTETAQLAPISPHISEEVSCLSVEDGSTIISTTPVSDQVILNIEDDRTPRIANKAKIQLANIYNMVKEKDFTALLDFGGIKGIAEALGTYLHSGMPGDEQDLHDRRSAVVPTTQAPTPSFFKLLLQSCFDWNVFLLLVCVFLSTAFGIQQEGPSNGWLEGAVGMFGIIILVVVPTMRKYFSVPHPRNTSQMEVKVRRGGNLLHISSSDVVPGDIVCLESGSLIPADGLFVSPGESLELKDGMELPTVDESNPFLNYGAKVVSGKGRMLVTCVGMKTALGDLMRQVRCTPYQGQLPAQLDKLSTRLQNVGLLITILMTIVLIIRSLVLKDNEYPGLQADQLKGKTTTSKELFNLIGRFFMKSSGQISVLATYLPLLIVGLSEVPFSIVLAITYWNKTTLSGNSNAQSLACFTMGSVSIICIGGGSTLNLALEVDVNHDGDQIIDTESAETMKAMKVLQKAGVHIIQFSKDNESVLAEGESPICYRMGRPLDELHMVQRLKEVGIVVAMVGTRTNETPALKEANVGIAMGTCISEMAKEVSDLIIPDGSLSFLVTIIRIGRCIHYNIQKYLQVELTMNISLLVTTSATTMFLGNCTVGPIQVVWANMLVTTLCGLALLVEPPTEELMEKAPVKQTESLISKAMWRNISLQVLYQAAILVAFQFKWKALLGFNEKIMESTVFSSYVLCQVFNLVSSREPEKKNVFRGILRTPWFWVAVGLSINMQVAFVEIAHNVAGNARLNWAQWGVCLLIAMVSWLIDLAGKCVWGVIMKIRITIGSDIGSTSMRSAAVSESASSRQLLV